MKRPVLTTCLALFAALAAPAAAQDAGTRVQDAIVSQLSNQGFTRIHISQTILGRVRVFATSPGANREIIFNPRTGEILRDYWDDEDDVGGGLLSSSGGSSSAGRASENDDDQDDGADRDDDADKDDGDDKDEDDDKDDKSDDDDDSDDDEDDD